MKLDIPDEYLPVIVMALEHYAAYTRAAQREDPRYQEAADWFKRRRSPASVYRRIYLFLLPSHLVRCDVNGHRHR